MCEKFKSFFVRHYLAIVAIVLGFVPISTALYTYYFNFNKDFGLSASQDDWGTFGDFVGGLTNPIYAFFAFVGVMFTLSAQREQNETVRQHKKQDEVQSLIQNVSAALHAALFDTKVQLKTTTDKEPHSVFLYLQDISNVSLRAEIDPDGPDAVVYKDELETVLGRIGYDLVYIQEQLELLAECLQLYASYGGSQEIINIYKLKYRNIAFMLYQIEYLYLQEVKDYFAVEDIKQSVIKVVKQERGVV